MATENDAVAFVQVYTYGEEVQLLEKELDRPLNRKERRSLKVWHGRRRAAEQRFTEEDRSYPEAVDCTSREWLEDNLWKADLTLADNDGGLAGDEGISGVEN